MTQVSKINGISISNTSITAYTYDGNNQLTIKQSDGVDFSVNLNTLSATSITATTFYGDGSNLTGISGGTGINTYTTGLTFTNNILTATNSTGGTYSTLINNLSGLTINGGLVVTGNTNISGTISSGGTNLDQIFTQNAFTTFSSTTAGQTSVISDNINDQINFSGVNIDIITDDTNKIITLSASTPGQSDTNYYVSGGSVDSNGQLTLNRAGDDGVVNVDFNLTKSIDFRAEEFVVNTASIVTLTPIIMSAVRFAGTGAVDDSGISFTVPQDYLSGGSIGIVWQTFSTTTTQTGKTSYDLYTGDTNNTGSLTAIIETINITDSPESTANVFIHSDFSSITTDIKAGDSLHMRVYRTPNDSQDTLTDNLDLINLIFKYTATR